LHLFYYIRRSAQPCCCSSRYFLPFIRPSEGRSCSTLVAIVHCHHAHANFLPPAWTSTTFQFTNDEDPAGLFWQTPFSGNFRCTLPSRTFFQLPSLVPHHYRGSLTLRRCLMSPDWSPVLSFLREPGPRSRPSGSCRAEPGVAVHRKAGHSKGSPFMCNRFLAQFHCTVTGNGAGWCFLPCSACTSGPT